MYNLTKLCIDLSLHGRHGEELEKVLHFDQARQFACASLRENQCTSNRCVGYFSFYI